jgi:hypothetical protein
VQVRSSLAGAHESQALEQSDCAIESDQLQSQRLVRIPRFVLKPSNQQRSDARIAIFGQ